jgi:hypothetical protein
MRLTERTFWCAAVLLLAWIGLTGQRPSSAATPLEKTAAAAIKFHDPMWYETAAGQLVFYAVLEGLYTDGVSNEAVDLIIPKGDFNTHFVYCCPLCHPAYEAFRLYRKRDEFFGLKASVSSFGRGLPAKVMDQLRSADRGVRLQAIQELIQTWVSRDINGLKLTKEERARIDREMEDGRRRGMESLKTKNDPSWPIKGCAICDGSVEACKLAPKDK